MTGKLLGKVILAPNYNDERVKGLAFVPFEIRTEDEDGNYYNCIIVNGKLLSGKGVGTIISASLDFHSPIENSGYKIIELTDICKH